MKELMAITLNAKQVREACEAYVKPRIGPLEEAIAEVDDGLQVVITVRRKRVRAARRKGNGTADAPRGGSSLSIEERAAS